jgi:hypothetical protein
VISVLVVDFIALLAVLGFRLIGKEVYENKLNYFMATFLLISTHIIISIRMIDTYNSVESKLVMMIISLAIGFVYFIAGGFIINIKKIITILICEVLQIVVLVLGTYLRL